MTRKPLTWYCPTCDQDVDPEWAAEHYGDVRSMQCGHTLLVNGTMYEAGARLGNALSDLGHAVKHAARDDWAWIRRKVHL